MTPRAYRILGVVSFILGTASAAWWQPPRASAETAPCPAPAEAVAPTESAQEEPVATSTPVLRFSEAFPDPTGIDTEREFIELENRGESGSMDGWAIRTDSGKSYALSGTAMAGQFVALPYATSKLSLLNAGMTLTLVDAGGTTRDTLTYGTAKTEKAFARGADDAWAWTETPTPGAANLMTVADAEPTPAQATTEPTPPVIAASPAAEPAATPSPSLETVVLSEFLPDPVGSDDAEWVELANPTNAPISLDGLLLDDIDGGSAPHDLRGLVVPANGWLLVPKAASKVNLNNDADTVRLLSAAGTVLAQAAYTNAPEGKSRTFIDGEWAWAVPTPGAANATPAEEATVATMPATVADDTGSGEEVTSTDVGGLDAATDELLEVDAVVTLPPGRIGTRTLLASDAAGLHGVSVRAYGNQPLPSLAAGDRIRVVGRVTEAGGARQLSTTGAGITRIGKGTVPSTARGIGDISADDLGLSVEVRGTVARKTASSLTLADDSDGSEIPVRLTEPPPEGVAKGATVAVIGSVRLRSGDVELMATRTEHVAQAAAPEAPRAEAVREPATFGEAPAKGAGNAVAIGVIAASGAVIVGALLRRRQMQGLDPA